MSRAQNLQRKCHFDTLLFTLERKPKWLAVYTITEVDVQAFASSTEACVRNLAQRNPKALALTAGSVTLNFQRLEICCHRHSGAILAIRVDVDPEHQRLQCSVYDLLGSFEPLPSQLFRPLHSFEFMQVGPTNFPGVLLWAVLAT